MTRYNYTIEENIILNIKQDSWTYCYGFKKRSWRENGNIFALSDSFNLPATWGNEEKTPFTFTWYTAGPECKTYDGRTSSNEIYEWSVNRIGWVAGSGGKALPSEVRRKKLIGNRWIEDTIGDYIDTYTDISLDKYGTQSSLQDNIWYVYSGIE